MPDDEQPIDRRSRHEDRPMEAERRLNLPPGRKVHAFMMRDVLSMRRTETGYVLRMRNGEVRLVPEAEMAALTRQSYLPQVREVPPGTSAGRKEDGEDDADRFSHSA